MLCFCAHVVIIHFFTAFLSSPNLVCLVKSVCLSVDPLHVEYLGRDLVLEVALDHCSSRYRYVEQHLLMCLFNC